MGDKWPKAVVQGLAFTQIVLVFLQLVNTTVVMSTTAIVGSLQMMLLFEMLLQHGFPVIMMLLLVSNMSYCMHVKAVMRGICPWFFWTSAADDEEVINRLSTASALSKGSHHSGDLGRPDTVGIHRL